MYKYNEPIYSFNSLLFFTTENVHKSQIFLKTKQKLTLQQNTLSTYEKIHIGINGYANQTVNKKGSERHCSVPLIFTLSMRIKSQAILSPTCGMRSF